MDDAVRPLTPAPRWQRALGYALAVAGLAWVFYDVHPGELWRHLLVQSWGWAALAILLDTLTYVSQGARWRLLLRPAGELSTLRTTQAVYVGLFTNELLPMRFGELVRAYLASRWLERPFSAVLPSMVVERLLDGVWLAVAVGLTAAFVPLPDNLLRAGDILGLLVLAATAVLLFIVVRREKRLEQSSPSANLEKPARRGVAGFVAQLADGLRRIGLSRNFYLAGALSALMLLLQAAAFWLALWACGVRLSPWAGVAVFLIVFLGTALPNAPANVGSYQFFCVVGLTLFGVEKTAATGASVVVFLLLTLPLWALGLAALARTGMTLGRLRADVGRLLARTQPG